MKLRGPHLIPNEIKNECRNLSIQLCLKYGIKPSSCRSCGATERVDRHHINYEQPWLWIWLCRTCHHRVHQFELSIGELPIFDVLEAVGEGYMRSFYASQAQAERNRKTRRFHVKPKTKSYPSVKTLMADSAINYPDKNLCGQQQAENFTVPK